MNFGGPVWHASVARGEKTLLKETAQVVLRGVGDAKLGEWHECTGRAYHIRRRLSVEEEKQVGPVVDIRGTVEATMRLEPVSRVLPPNWPEYRVGG